ncbi:MAG: right-handed parallel beta-helix repeat-containing protein, partial [Candidatus Cloacimonetes bacterium]|nr:right-handed parallel beta-helix repeat-containing protein [Candidatus Cloacimonadota bacterium]
MFKIPLCIIFLFILFINISAETHIPGGDVSGTWTAAESPYIIDSFIDIPQDSTLIIEPDVRVCFTEGKSMDVFGRLISIGTVSDSIIFTTDIYDSFWECISFQSTDSTGQDSSFMQYCKIEKGTGFCGYYGGALYFHHSSNICIDNCNISNNSALFGGGGIYLFYSSPTIINSSLINNTAWGSTDHSGGGGIMVYHGEPVLENLIIDNNFAIGCGGGMNLSWIMGGIINNITVTNNHAVDSGGGIQIISCVLTVNNAIIRNNISEIVGGGLDLSSSGGCGGWFNFCDISFNQAQDGGGIAIHNHYANFDHLTCYGNIATEGNGGAIYNYMNYTEPLFPGMSNSIIWGNEPDQIHNHNSGTLNIIYSDVQDGDGQLWFDTGCINSDPLFLEPETGDFNLSPNSPCIDSGDPLSGSDPDWTVTDMGAYIFDHGQPVYGIWDIGGSPYYIDSNIYVPVDSLLVVQVGVEVVFTGCHRLDVYGRLLASGTTSDSVRFRAQDAEIGWQGIRFINTDSTAQDLSRIQWGVLENCRSLGGGVSGNGGALTFINSSNFELNWSKIKYCEARKGGGIYCDNSSPDLKLVVIHDNTASETGGGICLVNDSYLYANRVTFSANSAGTQGGGLYCDGSSLYVKSSILWNNTPDQVFETAGRLFSITYSDVMGGHTGDGNIDIDPIFVDSENGDFRLSWENYPVHDETMSPCIDTGDPFTTNELDGTRVDMGG